MTTEIKPKKELKVYNAHQRAQAVLAVWTERRRPAEVCRQLGINSTLLVQWQQRAMAGMVEALQPRCRSEQQLGPALTTKLERLLARQALTAEGKLSKLERRLAKLPPEPTVTPPKEK
ncbi:transposase [Mycobacterium sp.]|uniref:transposase n=1 Tax=Mycobacterium sp. TaxID=1785 RepID=UPI003F9D772C